MRNCASSMISAPSRTIRTITFWPAQPICAPCMTASASLGRSQPTTLDRSATLTICGVASRCRERQFCISNSLRRPGFRRQIWMHSRANLDRRRRRKSPPGANCFSCGMAFRRAVRAAEFWCRSGLGQRDQRRRIADEGEVLIAAVDAVGGRRTGWSPDTDTAPVGAVGYLSLTAHCGTASPASRTSGSPNFAGDRRQNRLPRSPRCGR
ncbi:hypothetical protein MPL1032_180214 [Mesorhizobium plurifarium]|uniref:Uncharacterized protein n=1 Tax=Mesorhizobium plurifarium TaxID=69974 RepID=A0A0K2VTZ2_MESPL|nr:hypothetical protein MPL1032_180214 [Mesorhizobium plurifarium]